MLCAIIYQVLGARVPVESELALDHTEAKPLDSHVNVFCALGDNGVVGDSHGGGIFGLYGRLPLGTFNFYKSLA